MKKIALMIFMALGCRDVFCMIAGHSMNATVVKYRDDSESTSIPEGPVWEYVKRCYGTGAWGCGFIGDGVALEKHLSDHPDDISGLSSLVHHVANRLPCVEVYLKCGADPNDVDYYYGIRSCFTNRSYEAMVRYIELLSSYGMNPMKTKLRDLFDLSGLYLNLFEHIEANSLTFSCDRSGPIFDEKTKASLQQVIVRARDAYLKKTCEEVFAVPDAKELHIINELSNRRHGNISVLPRAIWYMIAKMRLENDCEYVPFSNTAAKWREHAQITAGWHAYKAAKGLNNTAGQITAAAAARD